MKVRIDLSRCQGHGRCYEMASAVFDCGPDGKPVVLIPEIDDEDVERKMQASSAEMMCPAGAITVE